MAAVYNRGMIRIASVALIAAAIGVAVGVMATLTLRSHQPGGQSDRVVGMIERCTLVQRGKILYEMEGDTCEAAATAVARAPASDGIGVANDRNELTVRPSAGNTYTVDVPTSQRVRVGDPWPGH